MKFDSMYVQVKIPLKGVGFVLGGGLGWEEKIDTTDLCLVSDSVFCVSILSRILLKF